MQARRDGANFPAFLKNAVEPHTGKGIHVVLDNLSTHTTPPIGSSWVNQIETWFGVITARPSDAERSPRSTF